MTSCISSRIFTDESRLYGDVAAHFAERLTIGVSRVS